jgi:hypothetical protein
MRRSSEGATLSPRRWLIALVVAIALAGLSVAAGSAATVTNGDFETGNFSGWTATDDGGGNGQWSITATGTAVCSLGTTNTPDGSSAALWDMFDPSWGILTHDLVVPTGGVLSVNYAYDNLAGLWAQDGSNPYSVSLGPQDEWLRIDVIKSTAARDTLAPSDILATIFDSQTGSPAFSQSWVAGTASLAAYAGQTVTFRVAAVNTSSCLPVWIDDLTLTSTSGQVNRAGYCSAAGDTNPYKTEPYAAGTFLDLDYGQPSTDSHYANATLASYVSGKGLTCDPPPAGYVLSGSYGPYPYWAPPQ